MASADRGPLVRGPRKQAPVLVIAGPTGSGKSALALEAAEAFGGVVINADSMQVYRELDVLTARPRPADLARAPHRLYGVLSVVERCSAGRWLELARTEIEAARRADRLPIVVGGSGLYLRSLLDGLAEIPDIPADVRGRAEALHRQMGGEAFRHELARLDPEGAARIAAGDRQRLIRAFEVARATGRPLSAWQERSSSSAAAANPGGFATISLLPERAILYRTLDARFETMVENGAVDEVEELLNLNIDPSMPAMKALGVRELTASLLGKSSMSEAIAGAKQSTRRFAKRQYTWLRHQIRPQIVAYEQYSRSLRADTLAFIRRRLLTADE